MVNSRRASKPTMLWAAEFGEGPLLDWKPEGRGPAQTGVGGMKRSNSERTQLEPPKNCSSPTEGMPSGGGRGVPGPQAALALPQCNDRRLRSHEVNRIMMPVGPR